MTSTPLLDGWQPPQGAGQPVAAIATTFVLEPTFFETDCLGRFLSLTTQDEGSGSVVDTIAQLEREDRLSEPQITVLADRSTAADRASLRWDLLHCNVNHGLLHSKVAILMWENATRVLIGSANLTSAGYRRQIEIGISANLGADCLLPPDTLIDLSNELATYLDLIPGGQPDYKPIIRARRILTEFERRVNHQRDTAGSSRTVEVSLAPTRPGNSPLAQWKDVWHGPNPTRALQLSPFWDSEPDTTQAVASILTGLPKSSRRHDAATVPGYDGTLALPPYLRDLAGTYLLAPLDTEVRALHAKCLLLASDTWIAALIGSSNHTAAGLGLSAQPHRELNVWLGAPIRSSEGRALASLIVLGDVIELSDTPPKFEDEDEAPPTPLPLFFEICRLRMAAGTETWQIVMQFNPELLLNDWAVRSTNGTVLVTGEDWTALGRIAEITRNLLPHELPSFVDVTWSGNISPWTVVVDDPHLLPLGRSTADLSARDLFAALAAGKSVAAVAEENQRNAVQVKELGFAWDPLARFDDPSSLLREGRSLAAAYLQLQSRLSRRAPTADAIQARLAGLLGPISLADKVVESVSGQNDSAAGGLFKLAELALAVGRTNWAAAWADLSEDDVLQARRAVIDAIQHLSSAIKSIASGPVDITDYAHRATQEALRCLSN
ncbi:hypothetical protein [Rhodococcus sp. OK302]|uniref:hypothetical protein n=1 Tax=Rhodococcus sp. OK302 TaxID=1882769 RepID=UPI000B9F8329|nr:hypothetical protein [Rhodococcus sp. OK302]OYD71386.1 hypothetical protein BDB13_5056 [Rhodococcus sp. OK302]